VAIQELSTQGAVMPLQVDHIVASEDDSAIAQEAKTSPRQAPKVKNLGANASDVGKSVADWFYDAISHSLAS
jgi:hypothetical protein